MEDPTPPGSARVRGSAPGAPSAPNRTTLIVGLVALLVVAAVIGVAVVRNRNAGSTTATPPGTTPTDPGTTTKPAQSIVSVCEKGNWPTLYEGKSAALATAPGPMIYLWRENDGWRVRAVDPRATDIKIVITGSAPLRAGDFKADSPDGGTINVVGNTATFTVKGSAKPNGFDFTACFLSEMSIQMWGGEQVWPAAFVTVGKNNQPLGYPIRVARST